MHLGPISFDDAVVIRQLRRDLLDDWFPDPIGFDDMLSDGIALNLLSENLCANHGRYIATRCSLWNVPKKGFTLRYALETSVSDRILFHALVTQLIPHFDPLIPVEVFSHRQSRTPERYAFGRGVAAWRDFVGVVRSEVSPESYILSTDLANYFENINLEILRQSLLDLMGELRADGPTKAHLRSTIHLLFEYLREWSFDHFRGLPQNRDASSFLANIYMLSVDRAMQSMRVQYFRYMDDIKIVCPDEFSARSALKALTIALRKLGLSINSKKTTICPGGNKKNLDEVLDAGGARLQNLDATWSSRDRAAILQVIPDLRDLALDLLKGDKVDTREFRFCVRRLEALAASKGISCPPEYFSEITDGVIGNLTAYPYATDQLVRYLAAVELTEEHISQIIRILEDKARCIYSWQNYWLWLLLAQKTVTASDRLKALALKNATEQIDTPNRAGASIVAGKFADTDGRISIAKAFSSLKSFLGQRSAILAVHELPFRPYIEKLVAPHIRQDLKGVYRNLRERHRGIYSKPPAASSFLEVVDPERDYD